jgi:hypothetical protein
MNVGAVASYHNLLGRVEGEVAVLVTPDTVLLVRRAQSSVALMLTTDIAMLAKRDVGSTVWVRVSGRRPSAKPLNRCATRPPNS